MIQVWGGFRCHILLPHDVVGTIIEDRPTWPGLTVEGSSDHGDLYLRRDQPVLVVWREGNKTTVTAKQDVWLQEPGLSVRLNRFDDAVWRGFGRDLEWTTDPIHLRHQTPDGLPQAYVSTVHFPRGKLNPKYTIGVTYRQPLRVGVFNRLHIQSDGGFTRLLDVIPREYPPPWQGCQVFGHGYELQGVCPNVSEKPLRRWELTGHPTSDQMHFLGWTGGAGAVVNEDGRTPPPLARVEASDGYDRLWDPRSWRCLKKGHSISQTLTKGKP